LEVDFEAKKAGFPYEKIINILFSHTYKEDF